MERPYHHHQYTPANYDPNRPKLKSMIPSMRVNMAGCLFQSYYRTNYRLCLHTGPMDAISQTSGQAECTA
jgi:hypothetical protein